MIRSLPPANERADLRSDPGPTEPVLDPERLDVFRVAPQFESLATSFRFPRGQSALRDHLDRASASTALNIAEAAGRVSSPDRSHFFAIARGSANECAAIVAILAARGVVDQRTARRARSLLVRVVQMLTKLITRAPALP